MNLTTFIKCESTQIPTQMIRIKSYLATPTKLDIVLSYCSELSDESKEKFCIMQDILKIGKLLGKENITPKEFYIMYDLPTNILEVIQHNLQVEYNTSLYRRQVMSSLSESLNQMRKR